MIFKYVKYDEFLKYLKNKIYWWKMISNEDISVAWPQRLYIE